MRRRMTVFVITLVASLSVALPALASVSEMS